jgi:hypothetical protein
MYCGAAIPEGVRLAAEESAARVASSRGLGELLRDGGADGAAAPPRLGVVIRAATADPAAIADAFALSAWEARQWLAKGSHRLVRVAPAEAARAEEKALRAAGLEAWVLTEDDMRSALEPWLVDEIDLTDATPALSGRPARGGETARRLIREEDVLIVVSGPIQRQRQRPNVTPKRPGLDRLDDGFRAHVHLRSSDAPIELDPRRVSIRGGTGAPAAVVVTDLAKRLGARRIDDNFRFEVPVLSESDERPEEVVRAEDRAAESARSGPRSTILDNARQFRSYSGWRGAVERQSREDQRTAS